MKKSNYFSEQDFLVFLSEHNVHSADLMEQDLNEGYLHFMNPDRRKKNITFVNTTTLIDEDEEEEKE